MAKREAIDSIYRQTEAAGKTAKSKAGKTVKRESVKTYDVKAPFKATYYISDKARSALEQARHERNMAGKRKGSDFSSLVDAAISQLIGNFVFGVATVTLHPMPLNLV